MKTGSSPGDRIAWLAAGLVLATGCGGPEPPAPSPSLAPMATVASAPKPTPPPVREPAGETSSWAEVAAGGGKAPTAAFDISGRLWVAFEQDGQVLVTTSADLGKTFMPSVAVNSATEIIETNGENRPKIAFGNEGEIYVSWTKKVEGRFKGDIRFTRSLDGGQSFDAPRTVNNDGLLTGHRFDSLHVDAAGHVHLVWIDKRDREAARTSSEPYRGAAIYAAVSTDRGASFEANRRVAHYACECCRIAVADSPAGGVAVVWRHIFEPNIRDHAFAIIGTDGVPGPLQRATLDDWRIDACPHHGPAMIPAGGAGYHLAWFTAARDRPAVYYGLFDPATGEMRQQTLIASSALAHPHLVMAGERLMLVWKEVEGALTNVYVSESADGGRGWQERRQIATTEGASDHPFLLSRGGEAFLSWHSAAAGLRIVPVSSAGGDARSQSETAPGEERRVSA